MKSILISIKPEWVAKILNGEKTIEIRKTAPKCDLPINVYVYCTKGNRYLIDRQVVSNGEYEAITLAEMHDPNKTVNITPESECVLNGKIVAKFTLRDYALSHETLVEIAKADRSIAVEGALLSVEQIGGKAMINYSKYTDDQLRKAYKDRCEEYRQWPDGSNGAFWEYEVMPIVREAKLRGIDL